MRECIVRVDLPDMPECCSKCNMPDAICSRRMLIWTRNNGRMDGFNSRHPDCPIVAVPPEKHGELIDRQVVYEKIKWWQENTHDTVIKAMLHEFYLMLFSVPPIISATEGGSHERLD